MSSGRKSSVKRHIKNYNIHNGLGQVISFVEYSVGRSDGRYQPQQLSGYVRPQIHFLANMLDKILQELENLIVKEIAKRIYDAMPEEQINNIETLVKPDILRRILDS